MLRVPWLASICSSLSPMVDDDVAGEGDVAGFAVVLDVVGLQDAVAVGDDDVAVEDVDSGGCAGACVGGEVNLGLRRRNWDGVGILRVGCVGQSRVGGGDFGRCGRRCHSRHLLRSEMREICAEQRGTYEEADAANYFAGRKIAANAACGLPARRSEGPCSRMRSRIGSLRLHDVQMSHTHHT